MVGGGAECSLWPLCFIFNLLFAAVLEEAGVQRENERLVGVIGKMRCECVCMRVCYILGAWSHSRTTCTIKIISEGGLETRLIIDGMFALMRAGCKSYPTKHKLKRYLGPQYTHCGEFTKVL